MVHHREKLVGDIKIKPLSDVQGASLPKISTGKPTVLAAGGELSISLNLETGYVGL